MDPNWFFRWIWRLNALALALVLMAAGIGLALPFLSWQIRPVVERAVDATKPAQQQAPKYRLAFDYVRQGRSQIVLTLGHVVEPERGFGSGSFSKDGYDSRVANYLFVDPATGATRWLFPTHGQMIASTDYLTDQTARAAILPGESPGVLRAVMYDVVPNAEQPKDKWTYQVFLSAPDGSTLTKVLDDLDEQAEAVQLDVDSVVIAYKSKGRSMIARFSLVDLKPSMQKDMTGLVPR